MDVSGGEFVAVPLAQLTGGYWLEGPECRDGECRWCRDLQLTGAPPGCGEAATGRAGECGPVLAGWAERTRVVMVAVAVITVICAALVMARSWPGQ